MFILSRFDRIVMEDILTYIYIRFRECSKCWKCWTMEIVYFERVRRREGVERAEGRRHSTRHYVSCIQIFFFLLLSSHELSVLLFRSNFTPTAFFPLFLVLARSVPSSSSQPPSSSAAPRCRSARTGGEDDFLRLVSRAEI